jgi:phosphonate transport system substrate-binding protein
MIRLLFAVCALLSSHALNARELVLGTVSTRPDYHLPRLQPIVEFASLRLKAYGVTRGRVLLAADSAQLHRYLEQGKVDWVGLTIASAAEMTDVAQPVLLAVDQRGRGYQSLYFVRTDSAIRGLADARGQRLVLRNTSSTSSYYVPLMQLQDLQLPLIKLRSVHDRSEANVVNILISGSETNSALWVAHGLADIGVANSLDWEDSNLFPSKLREQLRVVARSEEVPLGVELFSKRMPADLQRALIGVLLAASQDDSGRTALTSYSNTSHFEPISAELAANVRRFSERFAAVREAMNALPKRNSDAL